MRVLTTWMYFEPSQVKREPPFGRRRPGRGEEGEPDPGVGLAWFGGDTTTLMPISNLKIFQPIGRFEEERSALTEENLRGYVDLFLMDADEYEFREEHTVRNGAVVDYILTQPLVIERSPPQQSGSRRARCNMGAT